MRIKFEVTEKGIEIVDSIERHRERIIADKLDSITSTDWKRNRYPVDAAIKVETSWFSFTNTEVLNVRNLEREILSEVEANGKVCFPEGEYILELSKSMKIYVYINGSIDIESVGSNIYVDMSNETDAIIGARSYQTQPAGTITTTTSPTDIMQAVSIFGSAIKTTRPERAYPTLRGHPPLIKLGDQLNIPEELAQPNTGIQIKVRPRLDHVFTVAPLAYYLGAEVVSGANPQIVTENGYSFGLGEKEVFERRVERVLKQIFFLDCITRTGGHSPGPVSERQAVESSLDVDISTLYEQPSAERIKSYLEVPFSIIESQYPRWNPQTTIKANAENVAFLPFIAESLSAVTVEKDINSESSERHTQSKSLEHPFDPITQSSEPKINQSWKCNSNCKIESTTPLTAFHNGISQTTKDDPLEIQVVCNDQNMSDELIAAYNTYGTREEVPFNVNAHHNLNKRQLIDVFAKDSDFTHYIGHVDKDGFRCSDGNIKADSLKDVRSKVFFLNACDSHDQGIGLINAGSVGGIVTNREIRNDRAVEIGSTVARLLNLGYPLYAVVDIIRAENSIGDEYHIVGDGSTSIAQSKTVTPNSCSLIKGGEKLEIMVNLYPSRESSKGCIFTPSIGSISDYYLVQQNIGPRYISKSEFIKFIDIDPIPIITEESMYWSDEFKLDYLLSSE